MLRVIDELMWRLDGIQELVEQYASCQESNFLDSDVIDDNQKFSDVLAATNTVEQTERRRVVEETLEQLVLLDHKLDPLRDMLCDFMGEQTR